MFSAQWSDSSVEGISNCKFAVSKRGKASFVEFAMIWRSAKSGKSNGAIAWAEFTDELGPLSTIWPQC